MLYHNLTVGNSVSLHVSPTYYMKGDFYTNIVTHKYA